MVRRPSEKTTRMRLPLPALATTWLLVITWPCRSITKPEPVPVPLPEPTWIITVPGRTRRATSTVLVVSPGGSGAGLGSVVVVRAVGTLGPGAAPRRAAP